jgi:predicted metal-dependent HD superfamily phosphohydrolase
VRAALIWSTLTGFDDGVERDRRLPWPIPGAEGLRRRLLDAYGEPGRCYHDQRHLAEVLQRIEELRAAGESFDYEAVVLAAWFHDAVYDGTDAAEERSARWAEQELTEAGAPPELTAEVGRLVRMTAHHTPESGDLNAGVLSDADLAILAADETRYAEYVAAVRAEYAAVPDADFRRGRLAILGDLARKPHLFETSHARSHWESAARTNLAQERAGRGDLRP